MKVNVWLDKKEQEKSVFITDFGELNKYFQAILIIFFFFALLSCKNSVKRFWMLKLETNQF